MFRSYVGGVSALIVMVACACNDGDSGTGPSESMASDTAGCTRHVHAAVSLRLRP